MLAAPKNANELLGKGKNLPREVFSFCTNSSSLGERRGQLKYEVGNEGAAGRQLAKATSGNTL